MSLVDFILYLSENQKEFVLEGLSYYQVKNLVVEFEDVRNIMKEVQMKKQKDSWRIKFIIEREEE